jgi:hypothetical protein
VSGAKKRFEPRLHYPGGFETLRVGSDAICTTRHAALRLGLRHIRAMAISERDRLEMITRLKTVEIS